MGRNRNMILADTEVEDLAIMSGLQVTFEKHRFIRPLATFFVMRGVTESFVEAISYADKFNSFLWGFLEDLNALPLNSNSEEIQAVFFNHAKPAFGTDKSRLRLATRLYYQVMYGTDSGPRIGVFIEILGIDKFLEFVRNRLDTTPLLRYT